MINQLRGASPPRPPRRAPAFAKLRRGLAVVGFADGGGHSRGPLNPHSVRATRSPRLARFWLHHDPNHPHEHLDPEDPGTFAARPSPQSRDFDARAFTIGIGGPVGSGKTALLLALCQGLRDRHNIAVVTNDIFTKEDAEFLVRNHALPAERIQAVETGGCPHTAIRDDVTPNLVALDHLMRKFHPELLFVESGGDNLAAQFSRDLADFTIYVIDVSGGDKIPRKGGPGITQSDLLVINKIDLAKQVAADLGVMDRDAKRMRGDGPTIFAQVTAGVGVADITSRILAAARAALGRMSGPAPATH